MNARNRRIAWRESARLVLAVLMGARRNRCSRRCSSAEVVRDADDAVNALVQAVKARDRNACLQRLVTLETGCRRHASLTSDG